MGRRVARVGARLVPKREHAAERRIEAALGQAELIAVAVAHPLGPSAGEAVGLLLEIHGRGTSVREAQLVLHGVAPLVGQHHRHRIAAELLVQLGEQVLVVEGDELALGAIERVTGQILVGGLLAGPACGGRIGAVVGEDLRGGDLLKLLTEGIGHLAGPEVLDVGDRHVDRLQVGPCVLAFGGSGRLLGPVGAVDDHLSRLPSGVRRSQAGRTGGAEHCGQDDQNDQSGFHGSP